MISKNLKLISLILVLSLFLSNLCINKVQATGNTYYVSLTGSDTNEGTLDSPWGSINESITKLKAGDTLYIMGGVYKEKLNIEVSGTDTEYITISSYPGQTAVLDGTNLKMSSDMDAMIYIYDQSNLIIKGLEVRNFSTETTGTCIGGILVDGECKNIEIRNNNIHDIKNLAKVDSDLNGRDAHGIGVYGTSASIFTGLVIDGNTISNCKLGSSETLTVNGNISGFIVSNNIVYDNDNIGICFIGYENICEKSEELDRARNGICRGNIVYNIDSYGNPAYGESRSADGIYCDGSTNILIERNTVHDVNFGIELASEHKEKDTSYITVRDNMVFNCMNAGLALGGYDTQRGYSLNNKIVNNTFYNNDTLKGSFGEIYLQYMANNNTIMNNIFYANDQNLFVYDEYSAKNGNIIDYNIYYASTSDEDCNWRIDAEDNFGFANYQAKTGHDKNSIFTDPKFANVSKNDFSILGNSPVIDKGNPDYIAELPFDKVVEKDNNGNSRIVNGRIDCGAYENQAVNITTTTTTIASILYGDINMDNKIDNVDLVTLCQALIKEIVLDISQKSNADLNNDGNIDVADVATLKQYILGDKVILGLQN